MSFLVGIYIFLVEIYADFVGIYTYLILIYANLVGIYANLVGNYAFLVLNNIECKNYELQGPDCFWIGLALIIKKHKIIHGMVYVLIVFCLLRFIF